MPRDGSNIYNPPAGTTATAGTPIESAKYNALVADLTTDANLARPIVAGGTGATTAGAALANLGGLASTTALAALGPLTPAADRFPYFTSGSAAALATLTAAGRAILDDADAAAQRTTLGAQASDATLTSLAGLSLVAGDILYATGADTLTRLPKGTAAQVLQMNSGATAPEWGSGGADLFFRLNSAFAGFDSSAAQSIFPQSVTLDASTVYEYEIFWAVAKTAGATSHTFSTGFGGTATLNNIQRNFAFNGSTTLTYTSSFTSAGYLLTAASTLFANAVASAAVQYWNAERGTVSISGGGTFIPQYTLSAAPGGAYSTLAGSFFRLRRLGASGANNSNGSWA
jgi:hypothetical protein